MMGPFTCIWVTTLTYWRTHRFLKGHCPAKKMSSIGKYRRNMISFNESVTVAVISSLNCSAPILAICESIIHFKNEEETLSAMDVFRVESIIDLVFIEGCLVFLTLALSLRDMPVYKEAPRQSCFYVYRPRDLEPRRPPPPPPPSPPVTGPPPPTQELEGPVMRLPRIILVKEYKSGRFVYF